MKAAACSCSQCKSSAQPCSLTMARTSCTSPGASQAGFLLSAHRLLPHVFVVPNILLSKEAGSLNCNSI